MSWAKIHSPRVSHSPVAEPLGGQRVKVGCEGTKKLVHFSPNPHGADPWAHRYELHADPTEENPGKPTEAIRLAEAVFELVQRQRPQNPLPPPAIASERCRKLRALGCVE
jgi:hypothetical protein